MTIKQIVWGFLFNLNVLATVTGLNELSDEDLLHRLSESESFDTIFKFKRCRTDEKTPLQIYKDLRKRKITSYQDRVTERVNFLITAKTRDFQDYFTDEKINLIVFFNEETERLQRFCDQLRDEGVKDLSHVLKSELKNFELRCLTRESELTWKYDEREQILQAEFEKFRNQEGQYLTDHNSNTQQHLKRLSLSKDNPCVAEMERHAAQVFNTEKDNFEKQFFVLREKLKADFLRLKNYLNKKRKGMLGELLKIISID